MDIGLAVLACTTDGQILQRSAIAAHRVTLKMVEGNHEVIIGHVTAHDVVFDVGAVFHRNADLVILVHDIHGEKLGETMTPDDLPVVCGGVSVVPQIIGTAAISGVAFDQGAVHFKEEVLDEFRLQVIGIAALSGAHLDSHTPLGRNAQSLVNVHQ